MQSMVEQLIQKKQQNFKQNRTITPTCTNTEFIFVTFSLGDRGVL